MAKVYKCDLCGKIIDNYPIHNEWKLTTPADKFKMKIEYVKLSDTVDICNRCSEIIDNYLINAINDIVNFKEN